MTNPRDTYLLDALRSQLKAVGVQVCYGEAIGRSEICMSSGDTSMIGFKKSPFKCLSLLPSVYTLEKYVIYESLVFGPLGSGSLLTTVLPSKMDVDFEDKLISQHVRFQTALDDPRYFYVDGLSSLNPKERAALTKYSQGLVANEIAEELTLSDAEHFKKKVSQKQIENWCASARDKLGAKTTTEAVFLAVITRQLDLN